MQRGGYTKMVRFFGVGGRDRWQLFDTMELVTAHTHKNNLDLFVSIKLGF